MNHILRVCAVGLSVALGGCTLTSGLEHRVDLIERGSIEQAPLVAPLKSVSILRDGLACMDQMLREEGAPTTLIAIKNIPDASGLFSTGTKDMLITALSRMSRTSDAFRVVDYETDPLRQDTVQTMTNLLLSAGLIDLQKPQIYISGSISFGDKTVISKRKSIGVSTAATDTGYSWDTLGSVVGMDLHLGDMTTRTLYPGLDSANELVVATGGRAIEIGAKATGLPKDIERIGLQFDISSDSNQGAGAAVRALVDLAAIELMGKWSRVPYWQCIQYDHNHPEFARQMRQWYDDMSVSQRVYNLQRALTALGYWKGLPDGDITDDLRNALMRYQSAVDLVPNGRITFETYMRLLSSYVVAGKDGKFERVGWGKDADGSLGETRVDDALPLPHTVKPKTLRPWSDTKITLINNSINILRVGDPVTLRVVPSRTGYLYCYYKDAANVVSQIYPNPLQKAKQVQGGRSVLIPDITNPNTFLIEATKPGNEEVFCGIGELPAETYLPAPYLAANLEPIASARDLEFVKSSLANPTLDGKLFSTGLKWQVVGLPPGAAKTGANRGSSKRSTP